MNLDEFSLKMKNMPMTRGFAAQIDILSERYGREYIDVAERLLQVFDSLGLDAIKTARRYVYDYLKQMEYFLSHKDYGHADYDEVKQQIYDNKETMLQTYMPGLLLSYAYTTILYEKNHLFLTEFLPRCPEGGTGAEIGFGEGFYLWEVLRNRPDLDVFGFDISPYAVEFATNFLEMEGISEERFHLQQGNVLERLGLSDGSMDFVTFAEVLEHIPHPEQGLKEIARLLKNGGLLYLTTVMDSNHMDHISNFDSPETVRQLIRDVGLEILAEKIYHMTDDFPDTKDISVGLSFVAEKRAMD